MDEIGQVMADQKWRPIEPVDRAVEERLRRDLAALDSIHRSWRESGSGVEILEHGYPMHRTLRKHAIETGIIEGLYRIDRATTEVMVIKGLARGADAGVGGEVSPGVLEMLEAQEEGLAMVTEYARKGHPLTTSFIKELHAVITRAQPFHFVTDSVGRYVRVMMTHGSFKSFPNSVRRADGTRLDFAPPEQVSGEMERLVEMHEEMTGVHPVISAAWLHHRFVQIHPFGDGNGRVARALTVLPFERGHYPPIVVDRDCRDTYLRVLDEANDRDLAPLGRLFAKLAIRSIRRELDESMLDMLTTTATEDPWLLTEELDDEQLDQMEEARGRELDVGMLAHQFHGFICDWLREARFDLAAEFSEAGQKAEVRTDQATPIDRRARWWRREIIKTARRADHFAYLKPRPWWSMLRMTVGGARLRFVTSIHHVATAYTGVMAITSFADIHILGEEFSAPEDTFVETSWEPFTFSHHDKVEDRADELYEWLDRSLAVALQELMRRTLGI